ncbi:uncharacterized protein BDR25DRAFT_374620 [Lindgomyces ingoldianus]|uniref:Uncharacterized protein n=1 Tax=Lindgomyces ingoldianus TaxID=673940 RepID=A0ACB6QN87_9PLEO|nr:uncharacterized protein BDR25DRAFT_374620 [Lindgomyces ingoldianus]KAF2467757.1 hypothetical protein BDR25DRAFT_374620 [Lindgomyces ingoldianus]
MIRRNHMRNAVNQAPTPNSYTVLSDSKAAIQAIANPQRQSGHHIIQRTLIEAERLSKDSNIKLQLAWVPGHQDICQENTCANCTTDDLGAKQTYRRKCERATPGSIATAKDSENCRTKPTSAEKETLAHVFIDFPRLQGFRQRLRIWIGPRINSMTSMISKDIVKKELDAILEFAEKSGRFCSRDAAQ